MGQIDILLGFRDIPICLGNTTMSRRHPYGPRIHPCEHTKSLYGPMTHSFGPKRHPLGLGNTPMGIKDTPMGL